MQRFLKGWCEKIVKNGDAQRGIKTNEYLKQLKINTSLLAFD